MLRSRSASALRGRAETPHAGVFLGSGLARFSGLLLALVLGVDSVPVVAQTGRHVKVVIEIRREGTQSRQGVQGGGGVIIQQGKSPRGAGGLAVDDTVTTTTRSSGVFVLVQDPRGGEC